MFRSTVMAADSTPFFVALAGIALTVVVDRLAGAVYVEFPADEPYDNVIEAIQSAEREHGVVWDLLDRDLWEYLPSGYRVHGMFREEIYD